MPLSISNSENVNCHCGRYFWTHVFIVALLLIVLWEITLRGFGFRPSVRDSDILWANERARAISQQAALLGASRFTAALDPGSLAGIFNGKVPAQLATDGSQPLYPFFNLIEDTNFKGTILLSVVPGSFFRPLDPRAEPIWTAKFDCQRKCSMASKMEEYLRIFLQERLTLYAPETTISVNLSQLLQRKMLFPGFTLDPPWAQRALYQKNRTKKSANTKGYWKENDLQQLREFWPFIVEKWDAPTKLTGEALTERLVKIQAAVNRLTARGGKVIFVRMPSRGKLYEAEEKYFPRAEYWNKLASLDNALFINFIDYSELSNFEINDDSHLSPDDAPAFSKNLVDVIKKQNFL